MPACYPAPRSPRPRSAVARRQPGRVRRRRHLPGPIYERWFKQFPKTIEGAGVDVRYDAVGSGKGIAAFTERRVDFGATDVPLNREELAKAEAAGGAVIHLPTVLGAITVTYNLSGSPRLRMDAGLIADLFLGEIATWQDRRIKELNPAAAPTRSSATPT